MEIIYTQMMKREQTTADPLDPSERASKASAWLWLHLPYACCRWSVRKLKYSSGHIHSNFTSL